MFKLFEKINDRETVAEANFLRIRSVWRRGQENHPAAFEGVADRELRLLV